MIRPGTFTSSIISDLYSWGNVHRVESFSFSSYSIAKGFLSESSFPGTATLWNRVSITILWSLQHSTLLATILTWMTVWPLIGWIYTNKKHLSSNVISFVRTRPCTWKVLKIRSFSAGDTPPMFQSSLFQLRCSKRYCGVTNGMLIVKDFKITSNGVYAVHYVEKWFEGNHFWTATCFDWMFASLGFLQSLPVAADPTLPSSVGVRSFQTSLRPALNPPYSCRP